MKLITDLITFIKYKSKERNYSHLVFCENNNLYIYLEELIKRRKKSQVVISLEKIKENFIGVDYFYFQTNFFRIFFFLNLKVRYIYTTTPDLNNSLFMRSVNKICKYIYIQHSAVSLTMAYDENAFGHFDVVQVINKFQSKEIDMINTLKKKRIKKLKSRYLLFNYPKSHKKIVIPRVLIAPTWNTDFYKLNLHNTIIKLLDKNKIEYKFKPHYMSHVKKEFDDNFLLNKNVVLNSNIIKDLHNYTHLITDWSGIFFEFTYINKKKSILIQTNKKIRNSDYEKFNNNPIEAHARSIIGNVVSLKSIDEIPNLIIKEKLIDTEVIESFFEKNFYL